MPVLDHTGGHAGAWLIAIRSPLAPKATAGRVGECGVEGLPGNGPAQVRAKCGLNRRRCYTAATRAGVGGYWAALVKVGRPGDGLILKPQ
jgi:hypothetical protein